MSARVGIVALGAVGAAFIVRAASLYRGVDALAFDLVLAIGVALALGLVELFLRAARAARLERRLTGLPREPTRADVEKAPRPLRDMLEARLVGAPGGLSGAVLAPYLVGLLVMLGLLGTFLGLFETLHGAREALAQSADPSALREGLVAPMTGLSRAFGTSAAGVSASAVLGLAAVLARRSEARFGAALAAYVAGPLFPLTTAGRQLAALEALAAERDALPRAAEQLAIVSERVGALSDAIERGQRELGAALKSSLDAVGVAVRDDIARGVKDAAGAIAPLLEEAVSRTGARADAAVEGWTARLREDAASRRADEHAHRLALVESSAALAQGLREGVDEVTRKLETHGVQAARLARLADELAEVSARVDARSADLLARVEREVAAGLAAVPGAIEPVLARAVARSAEAARGALDDLAERADARDRARGESLDRLVAELDARDRARLEQVAHTGRELLARTEEVTRRAAELPPAVTRLIEGETTLRAARAEADERREARLERLTSELEGLAAALDARARAQAEGVAGLERELRRERAEVTETLAARLDDHAARLGRELAGAAELLGEAARGVKGGGAELGALAELFTGSVERYREASERWLDALGHVAAALEGRAASGDTHDLLGAYLDQSRAVHEGAIALQRELLGELRALRAAPRPAARPLEAKG